jgi:hypothetical protein
MINSYWVFQNWATAADLINELEAKNAELRQALHECIELIEELCPIEGATIRRARAALVAAHEKAE